MAFPTRIGGPYRRVRELAEGLLLVQDQAGTCRVAEVVQAPIPPLDLPPDPAWPALRELVGELAVQEALPGQPPAHATLDQAARLFRSLERLERASGGQLPRRGWSADLVQARDGSLALRALGLRHAAGGGALPEACAVLERLVGLGPEAPGLLWVAGRCHGGSYTTFADLAEALAHCLAPDPVRLEPVEDDPGPRRGRVAPPRRRPRHLVVALLLIAMAALGAWALGHGDRLPEMRAPAVYVGLADRLAMLDAATGRVRGTLPLDGPPLDLAAAPGGDRLFVLLAGRLLVLDTRTGRLRPGLDVEEGLDHLAAGPDGRLLLWGASGRLLLVRPGQVLRRERLLIEPPPVTATLGQVLVLGSRDRLRALRLPDLAARAEVRLPLAGPLLLDGDRLCVALRTGRTRILGVPGLEPGPDCPGGSLGVLAAEGRIWTVTAAGRLREVDPERGTVLHDLDVGEEVAGATLVRLPRGLGAWLPLADRPAVAVMDLDRGVRVGTLRTGRPLCFVRGGHP